MSVMTCSKRTRMQAKQLYVVANVVLMPILFCILAFHFKGGEYATRNLTPHPRN